MGKLLLTKKNKTTKPELVPIMDAKNIVELIKGKTLAEVDDVLNCTGIGFDRKIVNYKGNDIEILNLVIQTPSKWYQVPFSKTASAAIVEDEEYLAENIEDMQFRLTHKLDAESGQYTGPEYMSFGKPSGLSVSDDYRVVIEAQPEMVDAK